MGGFEGVLVYPMRAIHGNWPTVALRPLAILLSTSPDPHSSGKRFLNLVWISSLPGLQQMRTSESSSVPQGYITSDSISAHWEAGRHSSSPLHTSSPVSSHRVPEKRSKNLTFRLGSTLTTECAHQLRNCHE